MPDFKFALPPITALYRDQQLAYNPRQSVLYTGGPGSGKTVITIFRFLRAVRENKDITLFTFNRTLIYSIRGTLRDRAEELFGSLDESKIEQIVNFKLATFFKWHVDNIGWFSETATDEVMGAGFERFIKNNKGGRKFFELFFDEGQDLPPAVYATVFKLTETISVGADKAQDFKGFYPPDAVEDIINDNLNFQSPCLWQYLNGNFRNTREIFELAKQFVPNDLRVQQMGTSSLRSGNKPEIEIGLPGAKQLGYIKRIIDQNQNSNIGILVHKKDQIIALKSYLEGVGFSCKKDAPSDKSFSYYYSKMDGGDEAVMMDKLKTPFITTFDSCKGLEFDIVVLPFFETSDSAMEWRITRNHYYVAITRAKNDIFILCDKKPKVLNFYNEAEL